MLFVVLGCLALLALLDRTVRAGRVRLAELDFRFGLFEIRDVSRDAAINEEIPYSNLFDYMDTTLTRTLDSVEVINPWMALGYSFIHRNDPGVKAGRREFKKTLQRHENRKIARVYALYTECMGKFLKARYPISLPLAAMIFALFDWEQESDMDSVEEEERKLIPFFSFSPETSTFSEYIVQSKPSEVVTGSSLVLQ